MIFRNQDGKLVEINRYEYKNDLIYYNKIMNIKKKSCLNSLNKDDESCRSSKNYSNVLIEELIKDTSSDF